MFVLYRYLYDQLGIEKIGIWSLVIAATSVSRIGDLGLSAGVVRFVAQYIGKGDRESAADVVQTITITLGIFVAVVLVIGYPFFTVALKYLLPDHGVSSALGILPYALMSLWVTMIVSILSGGLDGCLRIDLRSLATAVSHLVYLGLAILMVPQYGLKGVAIAQLIQSFGLMVVLWLLIRLQLRGLPVIPMRWKFSILKKMFRYGVSFQVITVMNMLFDPIVKMLMSRFGGLESLGLYEMANGLVLKVRTIIVEANRVLVPMTASLQDAYEAKAKQLVYISYKLTFYVSIIFYSLLGIFMTTISIFWFGHYQGMFILFALLLSFGWFINTLAGPAYFFNLGSGKLGVNMVSHIIMGLSSLFIGIVFGLAYNGLGVVIGAVVGLSLGSIFLISSYIKQSKLDWSVFIIPPGLSKLTILSIFTVFISNYGKTPATSIFDVLGIAILCSITILILSWMNPSWKNLKRISIS